LRDGQRADEVSGVPIGTAAASLNVGVRSVKRARKVLDEGSNALRHAVDHGEVSVSKAAAVVDLPKSKQLAAAKATATFDERWTPDADEEAAHATARARGARVSVRAASARYRGRAHRAGGMVRLAALKGTSRCPPGSSGAELGLSIMEFGASGRPGPREVPSAVSPARAAGGHSGSPARTR
jgi:hypothetical protein